MSRPVISSAVLESHAEARAAALEQELQASSYIVSHDLAAAVRQVAGFSQLLLRETGDTLTGRRQIHAEHLGIATDRCQMMIEQLLAFSRVQQQKLQLAPTKATLVMRLALLQLGAKVQAAKAKVTIEPLGEVYADPILLALIFHHLLDNAIKFSRSNVPAKIAVVTAHDKTTWRIRISDNGPGVAQEFREKAFGMFRRLNGEGVYPGVGAGLALSRRVARRHGGELMFVDSAKGACLELALPGGRVLQYPQSAEKGARK